jgi:FkbM family methyltransferase
VTRIKTLAIELLGRVLPTRIKNSIFHLSFNLARSEFERFAYDYGLAPSMKFGLAAMARRGFSPRTIVDVGAFRGEWSRIARQIWPASRLVMIEPNVAHQTLLDNVARTLGARFHCELLGAEDGRTVHFNIMGSGSSIMNERSSISRKVEVRRLHTLDLLLDRVESPGLLKIDAQGYELEILKGALRVLSAFEAILLEVAIIEINEGAPLLDEVVSFMKSCGFIAYDILEIHRRPLDGALNQVDIVFIRERSTLIADKRHFA